jgi:hypothetical protein
VLSASAFSTLSRASLSARAAQASTSLIKASTLSLAIMASWAKAAAARTALEWVASTGIVKEPGGNQRNSGKLRLTNLDWVQDVLADHGRRLLQHPIRDHNP